MGIRGIGGIFFKAHDPEALAAWYERHLGVVRDDEGYTVLGWRELDRPDRIGETVWSPFPDDTQYFAPSSASWMVNYRVDDLDAELARLREEGVELVGEPEAFEYGKFGWVLDLEGNKIELWEPPAKNAFAVTVPAPAGRPGEWLCEPGTSMATDATGMDERTIVKRAAIGLPRADVWRLWTTSEGLAEWLGIESRIDLRVGGRYEFHFDPEAPEGSKGGEGCKVLGFVPDRMLSFTWNAPPHLEYTRSRHTHVVIELEAMSDDRTLVRLTHLGWPSPEHDAHPQWSETHAYFDSAWDRVLEALEESVP